MIRAIVLSIALLFGLGTTLVLTTDYTEAESQRPRKQHKKKQVRYRKYSRQWWRTYRQRQRRQQAIAQRRRAMRLRQIRLNRQRQNTQANQNSSNRTNQNTTVAVTTQTLLPSGETAPQGWKQANVSSSELQYRVEDDNGATIGSASISLVGAATNVENNATSNTRNKTLGGISTNSLRSTVIDRMVKENGWVVNDYQKEINGKKVYVVVAQSETNGAIQSRVFYFTEVDGKIYSVSTVAPKASAERITQESEKLIDSLQRAKTNPQQASK